MDSQRESDTQKPKVLVVDDEESVRDVLCAVLNRSEEYELTQASDGIEAQKVLNSEDIDVVVTDLIMPNLDGLGLMQWAQENQPGSKWIILTGRGTFDDAVRAVQLGAFDFISKPLMSMEPLLISVRNALREKQLITEQERLHKHIEKRNEQLDSQNKQLKDACRMLCHQADVIESDMRRAELIQRALLPRQAPNIDELAVNAVYRPSLTVGGDLYDVSRIDDNHVVIYVADAAGHGVSAAMLAVLFKHRLAMMDHDYNPTTPSEALAGANRSLMDECAAPGLFVTAAYCLLDTKQSELTIASAGHPPLLLCRSDGSQEMIYHTGPALGVSAEARFAQKHIKLGSGDRLLLYTDGLMEAPQKQNPITPEELAEKLANANGNGIDFLTELLSDTAKRRSEAHQEDDVTILLLQSEDRTSTFDNGTPQPLSGSQPGIEQTRADVRIGGSQNSAALSIEGRANWTYSAAFHDACVEQIKANRDLTLDLSTCDHLDSTFLGTIQEIVDRADRNDVNIRIQGLLPQIRELFEELGMQRVLDKVAPGMIPLPSKMKPLQATDEADAANRKRVLAAHQALASLSEENRNEFIQLITGLEMEMRQAEQREKKETQDASEKEKPSEPEKAQPQKH